MTTATQANETNDTDRDSRVAAITENLVELGTVWARYGLTVGRTALETSARSLTATASLLGNLAEALETKKAAVDGTVASEASRATEAQEGPA